MNKYHAVIQQRAGLSSHSGRPMITVVMVDLETRAVIKTYIDSANVNSSHWHSITSRPTGGFVVHGLNKTTRQGVTVINADSVPQIDCEFACADSMYQELQAQWAQQDRAQARASQAISAPNMFDTLFEIQ